jgi:hypothetical protein
MDLKHQYEQDEKELCIFYHLTGKVCACVLQFHILHSEKSQHETYDTMMKT